MRLIYITSDPREAQIVQTAGVDLVMVDLEILGKPERQGHLNTVISGHSLDDVTAVRAKLPKGTLLVRINPIHDGSEAEIEAVLERGADALMLPMFRTAEELELFAELVSGRAETIALLETTTALARLPALLEVGGIDNFHIGLNDLHLELKLDFMFELLSEGLVDYAAAQLRSANRPFGFGGVAPLGQGLLSAELILSEHLRLGSSQVILSRDFRKIFQYYDEQHIKMWQDAVDALRTCLMDLTQEQQAANKPRLREITAEISRMRRR